MNCHHSRGEQKYSPWRVTWSLTALTTKTLATASTITREASNCISDRVQLPKPLTHINSPITPTNPYRSKISVFRLSHYIKILHFLSNPKNSTQPQPKSNQGQSKSHFISFIISALAFNNNRFVFRISS